jgi:hypothetical protein
MILVTISIYSFKIVLVDSDDTCILCLEDTTIRLGDWSVDANAQYDAMGPHKVSIQIVLHLLSMGRQQGHRWNHNTLE